MATVFMPGVYSAQQFEILGGLTAAARRGGWLNNWANRAKLEKWLEEQRLAAEKEARRRERAGEAADEDGELTDILKPAEAETTHYGRERAAGLRGPLKFILQTEDA